jgi:hypothetical protein
MRRNGWTGAKPAPLYNPKPTERGGVMYDRQKCETCKHNNPAEYKTCLICKNRWPSRWEPIEELWPCPFCGSSSVEAKREDYAPPGLTKYTLLWYVECDNCGARGPLMYDRDSCICGWDGRA